MSGLARPLRRFAAARRGVVAMEFAIVGSTLVLILVMIIEVGLMSWTNAALQAAATDTARCLAIGSTACSTPTTYAVNRVTAWLFANVVTASNVTIQTGVGCNGAPGTYTQVKIVSANWIGNITPLGLSVPLLTGSSCFVSGP